MSEDVTFRIIKKIKDGSQKENVKDFLVWAIREEFQRQGGRWMFRDDYNYQINSLSKKEIK